jgi:hypothetical protein
MKKLVTLTAAALLDTTGLVYADNDHNQSGSMQKGGQSTMMMGMSGDMKSHMKIMKADMIAIQKETDPKKRKVMMKAHMKGMNSMMGSMKNERSMMVKNKHMDDMKQFEIRLSMMEDMIENMVKTQVILSAPDSVFKYDETTDEWEIK